MATDRDRSDERPPRDRRYPDRPIACVGAVILAGDGVVLVRRGHPPLVGRWTLPGGALDLGESLRDGVRREAREETGLTVDVGPLVDVVDHVSTDEDGRLEYHYVIVDYLCRVLDGVLTPGDDVDDARLVETTKLDAYALSRAATAVIRRAVEMYTAGGHFK
ncbi:MAG: NUDIX hydrolase [Acidobacteria bacterium]|nr:NUDIX hydrolase [Acidobacteriota bacterium]